jgi:hypothetical protein
MVAPPPPNVPVDERSQPCDRNSSSNNNGNSSPQPPRRSNGNGGRRPSASGRGERLERIPGYSGFIRGSQHVSGVSYGRMTRKLDNSVFQMHEPKLLLPPAPNKLPLPVEQEPPSRGRIPGYVRACVRACVGARARASLRGRVACVQCAPCVLGLVRGSAPPACSARVTRRTQP